ncbi:hypothetical protein HC823_01630 [Candidatus Gracilibacteria bacterium]|nr:hypothetical protein [Candidatus Gracilibacteria bacterium]
MKFLSDSKFNIQDARFCFFAESGAEGLDDLLMGNVAEGSEETSEQLAARIAAAQARLAKVQKDEATAKGFDTHLVKLIKNIGSDWIDFIAYLINKDVPSLTILAFFSVISDDAAALCFNEFKSTHKPLEEIDLSPAQLENQKVVDRLHYWWKFILRRIWNPKPCISKNCEQRKNFRNGWRLNSQNY